MPYEVELKYALTDAADLRRALTALNARTVSTHDEVDTYLAHPARSFAETDEALRVRRIGERIWLTYKGPKIDQTTKTRTEIEIELAGGGDVQQRAMEFWRQLGFRPVREVHKRRELIEVRWHNRSVHVSLDHLAGVGEFVELELSAEPAELEEFRQSLMALAARLNLTRPERRSYLELLLQKNGAAADNPENPEEWSEL
jgi:adenylate cyclase class 2